MIKLAVAVATEDAMPDAFVVWRGIEESLKKAVAYGYDGIELALKHAGQVNPDKLKTLCSNLGVSIPCISTGQVFAGLGLYFTHPDKEKRAEVERVFKELIDLASDFGSMVNIGRARGFVEEDETIENAQRRFVQIARKLAKYAGEKKVKLILEPVNRYEINFINSVEQGAALLETVGSKNMALMPDLFHMNIEDRNIGGELERFSKYVSYVHFADSNRLAPGQGHIDFKTIFESLRTINYHGWISIEILPKPDPDTAARQAVEYLRPLIDKYNKDGEG